MQTSPPTWTTAPSTGAPDRPARATLIVLSHLRWGFVFQRPQHLMTRLAKHFDVIFVEEPVPADGAPVLMSVAHHPGVEVVTPRTNVVAPGFHDDQMDVLRSLLADLVASRGIVDPLVWLYTPMALPLAADLEPAAVIYDCMDDLASFRFAPPQLAEREKALMELADVVLTGGPSLYEARKDRHPNIHCLPSAVDAAHYAPGSLDGGCVESLQAAELHRGLPHPRLGFFGVIDERLDLELVAGIADRRPDWQIVMVGPVVKIDPATLPQRPNIRWPGMQRYEALPHLMSRWDVCLLPFALNEATRFISPTKTLEYLAGGKPVVSTRIRDVESLYAAAVRFGSTADEFVAEIEAALAQSDDENRDWRVRAQALVDGCTWDGTAAAIANLLMDYVPKRAPAPVLQAAPEDGAPPAVPLPVEIDVRPVRPLVA
jgi:glycosyltransferase involved in cell wall biosynthesis